ncbi:MAG: C-GCAxxG-C-C family (seleno)protein [Oscillospiraceae bacterium]
MLGQIAENYYLNEKLSCAQSIFLAANDVYKLSLTRQDAKLVSAFAGGIGSGHICGALAGALSVMGRFYLTDERGNTPEFMEECKGFLKDFEAKLGGTMCGVLSPKYKNEERRCADVVLICGELLQEHLDASVAKNR